jgi:hypothetical protein
LVHFQLALQKSVGSLHALIEHQRTPHSFGEAVLDFLKRIRQYRSTLQVPLWLAGRGMSPPPAPHCYLAHACPQISLESHALCHCPSQPTASRSCSVWPMLCATSPFAVPFHLLTGHCLPRKLCRGFMKLRRRSSGHMKKKL